MRKNLTIARENDTIILLVRLRVYFLHGGVLVSTSVSDLIASNPDRLVGLKQVVRGISDGIVWCVIVSLDSDEFVKQRVLEAIGSRKIAVKYFDNKSKLGSMVGIDVAAAVVGLIHHA